MQQVLIAVPGKEVTTEEITYGTKQIAEIVGGELECVQLGDEFILYCNEQSINLDLPINPHFAQGIIKGTFVIAKKAQDGQGIGLKEKDIPFIMKTFIRTEPAVVVD